MLGKISLYGAGKTGIQTLVYLLKKIQMPVVFYDENTSYVQGISLDAMQSTVLVQSNTYVQVAHDASELENANVLIVCENTENKVAIDWSVVAKSASIVVIAAQDISVINDAIQSGISKDKILGVHGIADAGVLCSSVASVLAISSLDIQAMVFGGIAKDFKSNPSFVRAGGIPIDEIQAGSYEQALQHAKETVASLYGELWSHHYRLSSAAVSLVTVLLSGQTTLLPITSTDTTIPALVNNAGVIQWYPELCK